MARLTCHAALERRADWKHRPTRASQRRAGLSQTQRRGGHGVPAIDCTQALLPRSASMHAPTCLAWYPGACARWPPHLSFRHAGPAPEATGLARTPTGQRWSGSMANCSRQPGRLRCCAGARQQQPRVSPLLQQRALVQQLAMPAMHCKQVCSQVWARRGRASVFCGKGTFPFSQGRNCKAQEQTCKL